MADPLLVPVVCPDCGGILFTDCETCDDAGFVRLPIQASSREARELELGRAADALDGATRACSTVPPKGDTTDYEALRKAAELRFNVALNALHPPSAALRALDAQPEQEGKE